MYIKMQKQIGYVLRRAASSHTERAVGELVMDKFNLLFGR